MSDIDKYKDHFVLLLEAGFIAVNQADEDAALKLFKASQILNPTSSLPRIGRGYLHFHKLELGQAVAIFDQVLEREPDNAMAKTFKGMCLSLIPEKGAEGETILNEMASNNDESVKTVATTTKDFVNRFVKKSSGPASMQPPKK